MNPFLVVAAFLVTSPATFAAKACLGEIESQILSLAEAHVEAKGEGIRDSRVTIMHNYGCHGGQPLRCFVDSRVAVENENRVWSYFSFQSSYAIGSDCKAKGNVRSVQRTVMEGDEAQLKKNDEDGALLKLLDNWQH